MAWADVEWSNGDTPTEAKFDQMVDNADYLRDALRGRCIMHAARAIETDWNVVFGGGEDRAVRVTVGPYEFISDVYSVSSPTGFISGLQNLDVSGLAASGVYAMTVGFIVVGIYDTYILDLATGWFLATADTNYLSCFGTFSPGGGGAFSYLKGFTAIVTRDNESF